MGVDWHSAAVIGVKISNPQVVTKTRGCRHPEQQSPFCSECGKRMWETSKELHPKVAELYDADGKHPSGLKCCIGINDEDYYIGRYAVETRSNRTGDYDAKIDLPSVINIVEIQVQLREFLGDLYRERDFGLWSVLRAS